MWGGNHSNKHAQPPEQGQRGVPGSQQGEGGSGVQGERGKVLILLSSSFCPSRAHPLKNSAPLRRLPFACLGGSFPDELSLGVLREQSPGVADGWGVVPSANGWMDLFS